MRIAATVTAVLTVALVGVGVLAVEPNAENLKSMDAHGHEVVEAMGDEAMNQTVQFVDHAFQVDSVQGHTFSIEVPENATAIDMSVSFGRSASNGALSWTGLGDCDGTAGAGVFPNESNNVAATSCMLEAGSHDVAFALEAGVANVVVVMTAVVPA